MDVMKELNALSIYKSALPLSSDERAEMIVDLVLEDIPVHKTYYLSDIDLLSAWLSYQRVEETA